MKEWILIAAKYQEWISVLYLHTKKHKNLNWGYLCVCKKLPKKVKKFLWKMISPNFVVDKNMTHTK